MAVAAVMGSIRSVGLKVAVQKTETLFFYDRALVGQPPPNMSLHVGETEVRLQFHMKYLGLSLRWRMTV